MKHNLCLIAVAAACVSASVSCSRSVIADPVFETHASDLLDSTFKYYGVGETLLYNETYPKQEEGKVGYLAGEDSVFEDKVAYLWPTSGLFSAVNALMKASGKPAYRNILEKRILPGLMCYYDTTRVEYCYQSYLADAGHSDRFYDDNIWLGIDFTEAYEMTGNKACLESAEGIWRFIESGRDSLLGDGVYWCEQKKFSKNTCSNAPAAVLALKLYLATGKAAYLTAGKELYLWTQTHLQDAEDGLYFDNMKLDGTVDRTKFQYNSGQMMQAASLLYRITGEQAWLEDAKVLAEACSKYFMSPDTASGRTVVKRGNVWFVAVMLRGYEELYRCDGNPEYMKIFKDCLDTLWSAGRDGQGLFEDECLTVEQQRGKAHKWLLTQAAFVEMYARLSMFK